MLINPLNAELNPICHLLALLGAHHIFHVSGLRVKYIGPKSFDSPEINPLEGGGERGEDALKSLILPAENKIVKFVK